VVQEIANPEVVVAAIVLLSLRFWGERWRRRRWRRGVKNAAVGSSSSSSPGSNVNNGDALPQTPTKWCKRNGEAHVHPMLKVVGMGASERR
jgi:hypothetical protein